MSWWERPYGSAHEYEAAQKRVLDLMQHWQPPEKVTIHQFLVRVSEYGGYAVLESDDLSAIHQMTSTFAVFQFRIEPVIDVGDALQAESAAIQWRDSVSWRGRHRSERGDQPSP